MKIHHLNCGTMRPRLARKLNPYLSVMPCHCWLIEADDGLVLVDSGVGAADMDDPKRLGPMRFAINLKLDPGDTAFAQVQKQGFDPADVKDILITHLDLDHAGGLPDFPHARVHVHVREISAALAGQVFSEKRRYRKPHFAHSPDWVVHRTTDEPWFNMATKKKIPGLPEDLFLVDLAGHTRGHMGVAAKTDNGWMLHCGDAYDHADETIPGHKPPGFIQVFQHIAHVDKPRAVQTMANIQNAIKEAGSELAVCATHEPGQFEQMSGEKLSAD